jgi:hypothetical protein
MKDDETPTQAELAERALEQKRQSGQQPHREQAVSDNPADDPDAGMTSTPREDYPDSGAFDAEGQRPVLERSRKVR